MDPLTLRPDATPEEVRTFLMQQRMRMRNEGPAVFTDDELRQTLALIREHRQSVTTAKKPRAPREVVQIDLEDFLSGVLK